MPTSESTTKSKFAETMDATTFLVMGQHYWGQGLTLAEAKANFKRQRGLLGRGYTEMEFPPGVEFMNVDGMGYVHWRYADPDNKVEPVITEHPPKGRA